MGGYATDVVIAGTTPSGQPIALSVGVTVNTQTGVAGEVRAVLSAPRTKSNWVVTATTQGSGCDRVTTSIRVSTK